MMKFNKYQEDIIKKMVAANEIRELSLATLIDENSPAIALEWNLEKPSFTIHYPTASELPDKIYRQLNDIILLFKCLESEKLINLTQSKVVINCLYNRSKYDRKEIGDKIEYSMRMGSPQAIGLKFQDIAVFDNNDFGNDVMYYANRFFSVSEGLRDLVRHRFKSPEQRRHNQLLFWAIAAILITIIIAVFTKCNVSKNGKEELNQIKQSIQQNTLPDVIKTEITNDTLTTRIVEMPKANK